MRGALTMLAMGAAEDLQSAQTALSNVSKAAANNRNQVAKTTASTIKTEWSDMTADEKKKFKSTWGQTKGKWQGWKIDAATIKQIDDLVGK